jgi:hypothetical protein
VHAPSTYFGEDDGVRPTDLEYLERERPCPTDGAPRRCQGPLQSDAGEVATRRRSRERRPVCQGATMHPSGRFLLRWSALAVCPTQLRPPAVPKTPCDAPYDPLAKPITVLVPLTRAPPPAARTRPV